MHLVKTKAFEDWLQLLGQKCMDPSKGSAMETGRGRLHFFMNMEEYFDD